LQELEGNGLSQYAVLIKHWLRESPSPSVEIFAQQAAQALWLERRKNKQTGSN
jgi:hypothetical protein